MKKKQIWSAIQIGIEKNLTSHFKIVAYSDVKSNISASENALFSQSVKLMIIQYNICVPVILN
jgi:hypothetical protein